MLRRRTLIALAVLFRLYGSAWADTSLSMRLRTSVQQERGAVLLDDSTPATDSGVSLAPSLEGVWRNRSFQAALRLRPSLEYPHRHGGLLNSLGSDLALRAYPFKRLMVEGRADASGVSFAPRGIWDSRIRRGGRLRARYALRPDLFVSGSVELSRSDYGAPADSLVSASMERSDRRRQMELTALWYRSGTWAYGELGRSTNRSSLDAYGYTGISLAGGLGFGVGPFDLSFHGNQERRQYGTGTDVFNWRTVWASAELAWEARRGLEFYTGLQTEFSYRDGVRVLDPWTYKQVGVRLSVPLHARRSVPARKVLRRAAPKETPNGWVFYYRDPNAERVHLVGTFSGWDPEAYAFRRITESGLWEVTVALDPGIYEYAYVVDGGEWVAPPEAPMYVDDGFGNRNAVLVVEGGGKSVETAADPR